MEARLRIYGIKTCDSCRKAVKALGGAEAVEFVDVRSTGLSEEELNRFVAAFGDALVNRKSKTWRDLDGSARDGSSVELIAKNPTLMKRPVIDGPQGLTLGWSAEIESRHRG